MAASGLPGMWVLDEHHDSALHALPLQTTGRATKKGKRPGPGQLPAQRRRNNDGNSLTGGQTYGYPFWDGTCRLLKGILKLGPLLLTNLQMGNCRVTVKTLLTRSLEAGFKARKKAPTVPLGTIDDFRLKISAKLDLKKPAKFFPGYSFIKDLLLKQGSF